MKLKLIYITVSRGICWILLLQMINISINPPDFRAFRSVGVENREDLSINEIESIYELISESLFGEDVPETNDEEIDTSKETPDLYFFTSKPYEGPSVRFSNQHFSPYLQSALSIQIDINFPPPKLV